MSLFRSIAVAGSALTAQRLRMDVIANNVANVESTSDGQGGPFRGSQVIFRPQQSGRFDALLERMRGKPAKSDGVVVAGIVPDTRPGQRVFDPSHPDADGEGFVIQANIDLLTEMANMLSAIRSFQANVTTLNASKRMIQASLEIGR